jgi:phosphatidylglycerol:prolipoprotein diacylglycerol transferase
MLIHPGFDPVALHFPATLFGFNNPIKGVHWYGLTYVLAFYGCYWLAYWRGQRHGWSKEQTSDLIFYIALGVVLGGRIGYTLFYNFPAFRENPAVLFQVWNGGMSFHGGLIGVVIAEVLFARKYRLSLLVLADVVASSVPFGLLCGRIGNFINAELWGAPTTLPWAMVFPTDPDRLPRHPSMLYEALLEGVVLLSVLWWYGKKPRPVGSIAGLFLLLYGFFRILVEIVRVPDAQLGYLLGTDWLTMGMSLCLPMIAGGAGLMVWSNKRGLRA